MIPLNKHIEVEPVVVDDFIASAKDLYEEKGLVVSVANDVLKIKQGWLVYFDGWQAAKYQDANKKVHWLVPEDAIRAYEIPTE